ncbi:HI0074 family nucleotidyltransferase substrate-binding subunit [Candidatus Parcubacteria bacterium]|nr:HI0074 family nucleotidyltransferase substrate-binding subunit [Candidatus Parcubacteria bacterium]
MDSTLSLKLNKYKQALDSLEIALKEEKSALARDSVIKRFEYTYELCWKTAKVFLSKNFGVDVYSPKECFRELRKNGLVSDEETELLLMMTDNRNEIIHTYNEQLSTELYETIKEKYFILLTQIYKALKK